MTFFVVMGLAAIGAVVAGTLVLRRPSTGLLLLAGLAPFDGLLIIVPHPSLAAGWKEGLVLAIFGGSVLSARGRRLRPLPQWVRAAIALVVVATASAVLHPGIPAILGLKIGFFYLLVPISLHLHPLSARDRDRLVTIIMGTGAITAVVGIAQQLAGPETLVALGYEYNENVRFASGILRSFSTFNQPFAFAFHLMVALLVGIPVALEERRRLRSAVFAFFVPLMAVGIAVSVVRAALLGLAVGAVWLLVHRYRVLAHVAAPLIVAGLVIPVGFAAATVSSSSLGERSTGWSGVVIEAGIEPIGQGIGSVGSAAERVSETARASDLEFPSATTGSRYQPDNYYIKTLVELGPIGVWLLIWVLGLGFAQARRISLLTSGRDGGLAAGIAASILAASVCATVSSYWEIFPSDLYFWMLLGVLPSLSPVFSTTPSHSLQVAAASKPTAEKSSGRSQPRLTSR